MRVLNAFGNIRVYQLNRLATLLVFLVVARML